MEQGFILRKIKKIVVSLLRISLFRLILGGGGVELFFRHKNIYKRNFGKIKFQGEYFQDMIAYLYLQKKNKGFFMDIGANDGISASNTYIFEQIGWQGVCIEPQPDIFLQLKRFRKCDCYNVALSSQSGDNIEFFKAHIANGLSGLNEGMTEDHKNQAKKYGKVEYIKVKTRTFDEVMKNYPKVYHIDFMSIDVEGHEMNILKTIDFTKYTFGFITIEKSEPEKIKAIMEQQGYKYFMELGADLMFVPQ